MRALFTCALLLAITEPAVAQRLPSYPTSLDSVLRHTGNNLFGNQCGYDELRSIGVWGDQFTVSFRTAVRGRFQVRLERVWGVATGAADRVLADGQEVGRLTPNQEATGPECGGSWTSPSFDLDAGSHVLTIRSGALGDDVDDVAFQGVTLLAGSPDAVIGHGKGRVSSTTEGPPTPPDWMEALMDTTTMLATFGLLAFLTERLTNGIAVVLGYWTWWRIRMEVSLTADPDTRARIERNRRVGLFGLSAVLAMAGAVALHLDVLAKLGLASPTAGGAIVTGLLIASGADPIRELLKGRESRRESSESPAPIQITGTLVLQTPAAVSPTPSEDQPAPMSPRTP